MVHKIYNNRAPEYFKDHLCRVGGTYAHYTRTSVANMDFQRFNTGMCGCSFRVCGAQNWNTLPLHIKCISNHQKDGKFLAHRKFGRVTAISTCVYVFTSCLY